MLKVNSLVMIRFRAMIGRKANLKQIRDMVQNYMLKFLDTEIEFDYALVHLYRDGKDKIDKHSDREARKTHVASLSLGERRKFRFQRSGLTSGWEKEFELEGGDLLDTMKPWSSGQICSLGSRTKRGSKIPE